MKSKILYADQSVLVVHKPAGIAVESASVTQMDVISELKNELKLTYIGLVHRLDQPVEGLFVVGKTKQDTAKLTKQLQEGSLSKSYLALAYPGEGVKDSKGNFFLQDYLYRDPKTRRAVITTDAKDPRVKEALLSGSILQQTKDGAFLCRIRIETGRFHQIRAQMAHAGMPLLGDEKYGSQGSAGMSKALGIRQLCLCADQLSFLHPKTGRRMEFSITPAWSSVYE
ncbi:MAG: RluA family pseudouridine synthase [Lachnospiraceae bacterium]|nr:RluA family pseudouridine synthase [Lachnospiraceae bacterium]